MELKPCPFCGGVAELKMPGYEHYSPCWCKCTRCGAEGPTKSSEFEAEKGWNERIQDDVERAPIVGGWISVKDRLPPEKETIFARCKGTNQWNPAMFATSSEDVRVVVRFEDGTRMVWHDNTMDGKWKCEREKCAYPKRIVTHWMPNPKLPKEREENE